VQSGSFGPIRTFAEYASPSLKTAISPTLAGRTVMSLGMSEPDAGSAVTDLKTTAKPEGTHYVINGTKVFSTFSPDATVSSSTRGSDPGSAASAPWSWRATHRGSGSANRRAS